MLIEQSKKFIVIQVSETAAEVRFAEKAEVRHQLSEPDVG